MEVNPEINSVTSFDERVAVCGALFTATEVSLTPRQILEGIPRPIVKKIIDTVGSWHVPDSERKYWREMYLEDFHADRGDIESDPENPRRYRLTEQGQNFITNWLANPEQ